MGPVSGARSGVQVSPSGPKYFCGESLRKVSFQVPKLTRLEWTRVTANFFLAGTLESIPHIFVDCPFARSCLTACRNSFSGCFNHPAQSLISLLITLSPKGSRSTMGFFLLYQLLGSLWLERNEQVLGDKDTRRLNLNSMAAALIDHVRSVFFMLKPSRKSESLLSVEQGFHRLIKAWNQARVRHIMVPIMVCPP